MSSGEGDLTKRVVIKQKDEIGEVADLINNFIEHLDKTFSDLISTAMRLLPMSEELAEGNTTISDASLMQNQQILNVKERLAMAQASSDEVRALASRTRESTLQVSGMVNAIQNETNNAVETMTVGISSAKNCNNQVDEAKAKLASINAAVQQITEKVDVITNAVGKQDLNFSQVSTDFERLDTCFEDSKKASDVTVQIGIDMGQLSTKLSGMVNQFKLTNQDWYTARRKTVRIDEEKVDMIKRKAS